MQTIENIELIIEALELLYTKKYNIPICKVKIIKQLEYWHYEKTVIETINNKKND